MKLLLLVGISLLIGIAATLHAQTLTLRDAISRADDAAYQNRIAEGVTAAQRGQATATLRGILPTLRLESGFVRTVEPLSAFGTALRQSAITQSDFDPARLNRPPGISNFQAAAVVEQPIFNADAWTGRQAASRVVAAAEANADWTRLGIRVDVIRAYYGATLAHERVATLVASARAAHAHARQAEAMVRQGLVTKSDALLAGVGAGEVDAQLADAEAEARTAIRELALVIGQSGHFAPMLPDRLPSAEHIRSVIASDTADYRTAAIDASARADVRAADLGLEAARLEVTRARSLYIPRLNGFARYDWNSATRLYSGDAAWTVGVMATWSPFAGAGEIAELQSTVGREDAARAVADVTRERGLLEVERSGNALRAALARLDIAERSVEQGAEAHRIVARKYEGGLATVSELLDAAATDTRSALGLSSARYAVIVAGAERLRALGRDPGMLARLDADALPVNPSR